MIRWLAPALVLGGVLAAHAQPSAPAITDVRIDERIGERVPLDLWFSDTAGRRIQLRDVIAPGDGRPVLLVLSYVRCRLLCSVVLRGATEAIREMPLELSRDYRFVVVSIDPREEAASGAARTRELRASVGGGEVHYLVGAERPIRELADALGFHYTWDDRTEQFAHPAVAFVLSPDGTIAHYLHGVKFAPDAVADALRGAALGERGVSPSIAASVLACFRFDPAARAHREMIESYLRIGAVVVMALLGSTVVLLFLWERRRRRP